MVIPKSMFERCQRCGHEWLKRMDGRPKRCPKCKQRNWDSAVGEIPLGRPPKTGGKAGNAAQVDPDALWLWGRLKDFERWEFADRSMEDLLAGMAEPMREDSLRIGPELSAWLKTARPASSRKKAK